MTVVAQQKQLLRVIELAGPAGAGKSTVVSALLRQYGAVPGSIWGQPVLSLLSTGVQLTPTLLDFWRQSGSLLWHESRHIVRLSALRRSLGREQLPLGQLTIFDEGPVFALAWLRGFGHESMRTEFSEVWWQATLRQWAGAVDAIAVLDAPDALLAERIRARPQWHEVKHASDAYIATWMDRFRSALDWVLAGLVVAGGPTILRISTDQDDPECIAERLVAELDRRSYDN
jgi:predicted ATPase